MPQHEWISESLCWINEARHKKHMLYDFLYRVQENANLMHSVRSQNFGEWRTWESTRETSGW